MSTSPALAVVLSGGGARASYQVGVLAAVSERYPDLNVPILTGVSAGAINTIALAAHPGSFGDAVTFLQEEWRELTFDHVYRVQVTRLMTAVFRWAGGWVLGRKDSVVRGLLDMSPLCEFLGERLSLDTIDTNLHDGRLRAAALSATKYGTGETITFVANAGDEPLWHRYQRRAVRTDLTWDHVLASASIPLIFPAVKIGEDYYGDGSVRQVAPLAPAIHLGASHILAIGMRPRFPDWHPAPTMETYPSAAQAMGLLFNSLFLDALDADAERLERTNALLARIPPGTPAPEDLREVRLMMVRPSMDLGALARPHWRRLPRVIRTLVETIGGQREGASDFISYLLFDPAYTVPLMELGYDDAVDQWDAIDAFLDGLQGEGG